MRYPSILIKSPDEWDYWMGELKKRYGITPREIHVLEKYVKNRVTVFFLENKGNGASSHVKIVFDPIRHEIRRVRTVCAGKDKIIHEVLKDEELFQEDWGSDYINPDYDNPDNNNNT